MMPDVVQFASALVEVFEGCHLHAYPDSGGIWTIGIGHTHGVHEGQTITREQADQYFAQDQAPLLATVTGRPLLEAAALVSFGFNCGLGTLREYLAGQTKLEDHVHDRRGHVLPGLVARRRLESMLIELGRSL